jgi:hypothetical protein
MHAMALPVATPVTIFNANELALTIAVNRGAVAVLGPVDGTSWAPATSDAIGWSDDGAAPGKLAPGANEVVVQFGACAPVHVEMNLPKIEPASVQLYFFLPPQTGVSVVTWFALYAGVAVANGVGNGGAAEVLATKVPDLET